MEIKDLNAIVTHIEHENLSEGPLSLRTVAIKDNVSTKGIETTASSKILEGYIPLYDATIIEKLKSAGAQLVCKTTLDELALGGTGLTPCQGATRNPYDLERISGGSSSGSAALMGAHAVDFAIGTDTGDSIRKPAAYCGVVGLKPSYSRISRYGVIPYASSLDHVGFFTHNVMDSALMLEVLSGFDEKDFTSSPRPVDQYTQISGDLRGRVIGVIDNLIEAKSDDALKARFLELLKNLEEQGVQIKHLRLQSDLMEVLLPVYYIIANCEATANHANLDGVRFGNRVSGDNLEDLMTNSRTQGFGPLLKRRLVIGSYALQDDHQEEIFRKAQRVRRLIVDDYTHAMSQVDAILTLSSDTVASLAKDVGQEILRSERILAENHLVLDNFSGFPSISMPLDHLDGLPYGINLATNAFEEKKLLDIALGLVKLIAFYKKDKEINPWRRK